LQSILLPYITSPSILESKLCSSFGSFILLQIP
jgi:hypothetical protein